LDEHGQKLSKSLRNYPDPVEMFEKTGADALRWFLMSSPILRGGDLQIQKDGKQIHEVVRLVLNPIWNAYYFFTLYANADGFRATLRADQTAVLDRYALSKTRQMVAGAQKAMDAYDLAAACQVVKDYLDALNNWYIRRSRPRFWGETGAADQRDAYDTLYTCLVVLCRACAPLLPLLTETVFTGLTGEPSVHLANWPDDVALPHDSQLVAQMDRVRDACSVGLALRETKKLRTRLPLPQVTLAGADAAAMAPFAQLLQDELNVKHVGFAADIGAYGSFRLQIDAKALGPKLGPKMKDVLAATRTGAWKLIGDRAEIGGAVLDQGEYVLQLVPKDGITAAALSTNDVVLVLDTAVTPELEQEGVARDFVRLVQQARKDAGLHVSDRVHVAYEADAATAAAVQAHAVYVAEQVLATSLTAGPAAAGAFAAEGKVGAGAGAVVKMSVRKA
ncbi:MAG: class I tRNA ligase family protein, partial [Planctomycetes bacterium]|nr:class I tRNA ligase family protein [Planctomycetota bacterium]